MTSLSYIFSGYIGRKTSVFSRRSVDHLISLSIV